MSALLLPSSEGSLKTHGTARTIIALTITAIWVGIAALHVHETWPPSIQLDSNDLWAFLAGKSGALAFFWLALGYFWLVIGYFEQRAERRQNSERGRWAAREAEMAIRLAEAASQKLDEYEKSRIRAAQPRWEGQGCIAHKEQHEINLRNVGAAASRISAKWNRNRPMVILLSNTTFVDTGQYLAIKVVFQEARLDEFDFALQYCDATGEARVAHIAVSDMAVKIEHQEDVSGANFGS